MQGSLEFLPSHEIDRSFDASIMNMKNYQIPVATQDTIMRVIEFHSEIHKIQLTFTAESIKNKSLVSI